MLFLQKKVTMKKYFVLTLCFLLIMACIVAYYIMPYYSPAVRQEGLVISKCHDDTIRIAYIGDSWADGHKKIHCIIDSIVMNSTIRAVMVKTAGISGLTSKNVYYSIFRNDSIRSVIEWGPDFCFVSAGINDSDRKMGTDYYKENMRLIIDLLLTNNITPIIMEIPTYDIKYSYERRNRKTKLMYIISMILTWSEMNCIQEYRNAYWNLIQENNWHDKVISIRYTDWNPDGYKDKRVLYDEGRMHLNDKGYQVLDSCISNKIIHYVLSNK